MGKEAVKQVGHKFLGKCQVDTPREIVVGVWKMIGNYRSAIGSVLDVGAGDARFAEFGKFSEYDGYEIDKQRLPGKLLIPNAKIINKCAFKAPNSYDLCVGNPPYVRHHDIELEWRERAAKTIEENLNVSINRLANAFIYFIWLSLLKTKDDGLISLIVPYEWVSRPSAHSLREYIRGKGWAIDVFRFDEDIFPRVLTTASLTVIDKSKTNGKWQYFNIDRKFRYKKNRTITGTARSVLGYRKRGIGYYALRGLSPGTQKVFVLSEGERVHYGLRIGSDVSPCVTTLRHLGRDYKTINKEIFYKHFVHKGIKCWLIRSDKNPSQRLMDYLSMIPKEDRATSTCTNRDVWWEYKNHPVPKLLVSSGFVGASPKVLNNAFKAFALGGVLGVHGKGKRPISKIANLLRKKDFKSQVIWHANALKKIEIGQMNYILGRFEMKKP